MFLRGCRVSRGTLLAGCALGGAIAPPACPSAAAQQHVELVLPAPPGGAPFTGRAFLFVSYAPDATQEPRQQSGSSATSQPFFGVDVAALPAGGSAVIDAATLGFPRASLAELPAGDVMVQALFLPYTEFRRADGRVVWAHMDEWAGQRFNDAPGAIVSAPRRLRWDPASAGTLRLEATRVLPPVDPPRDTEWVERFRITSARVSAFWGHPMPLGATVLLPRGYRANPKKRYPVVYQIGHFSQRAPFGFTLDGCDRPETEAQRAARLRRSARETGCDFARAWTKGDVPEMIAVYLLHPTPFYDDSYVTDSPNHGPYGTALVQELIPEIDRRYRTIAAPHARLVTGGSTGGWDALALQVRHPDVFGGAWSLYPDQVDFRRYQFNDIYADTNAFVRVEGPHLVQEIPSSRDEAGMVRLTVRQESQAELVMGTRARSGGQFDGWVAAWAPVGDDGYPRPLWDKRTGTIDRAVAEAMRAGGHDLRAHLEANWATLGPKLVGKLHVAVGDMDNYFLNLACYHLEEFLERTKQPGRGPYYAGSFTYGRPLKPHGWQPWTNQELLRRMAHHVVEYAPRAAPRAVTRR
ncbi:MAG: alpha/beta hydrolase-fold protein [Gemmatimonadales bacterium]|nr:alpha/beta hydrolase-fold protein [Gemmatimonadales bacterium]